MPGAGYLYGHQEAVEDLLVRLAVEGRPREGGQLVAGWRDDRLQLLVAHVAADARSRSRRDEHQAFERPRMLQRSLQCGSASEAVPDQHRIGQFQRLAELADVFGVAVDRAPRPRLRGEAAAGPGKVEVPRRKSAGVEPVADRCPRSPGFRKPWTKTSC